MRLPIPDSSARNLRRESAGLIKGVRGIGVRIGNWLTAEQDKRLLAGADRDSLRGKRNYAILGMLIGCGLRRGESPGGNHTVYMRMMLQPLVPYDPAELVRVRKWYKPW